MIERQRKKKGEEGGGREKEKKMKIRDVTIERGRKRETEGRTVDERALHSLCDASLCV